MIKPENRFIRAVKDFFGVSPFPDYPHFPHKAKYEAEQNVVKCETMSCGGDNTSGGCKFYTTNSDNVTCATCGDTTRI